MKVDCTIVDGVQSPKQYSWYEICETPGVFQSVAKFHAEETIIVLEANGDGNHTIFVVGSLRNRYVCKPVGVWPGPFIKSNRIVKLEFSNS